MIRPVIMPKLGDTVEEAKIVNWLRKDGDWIHKGDPILVAETDKVSIEVESLASGYLRKPLYPEGQVVPVTHTIAYLSDSRDEALPETQEGMNRGSHLGSDGESSIASAATFAGTNIAVVPVATSDGRSSSRRVVPQSTPVAKRLARERGIELSMINGSGLGGRITERDVLNFFEIQSGTQQAEAGRPVPLSTMRRHIAERMSASKATAPHFYITTRIDMSRAMALRADLQRRNGQPAPSYLALVIKAVAGALKDHSDLNSSYVNGSITVHAGANIGVAVSLDDGLVVPVVKDVDKKGVLVIAKEVEDLATKARTNRLLPADYEGGSFTVSNLGMYPVDQFVAIINPPQAAILALGRISLEPVAISTESGNYLGFAHLMHATLSVDHRIVDGARAARFIASFKESLEKPDRLLEC